MVRTIRGVNDSGPGAVEVPNRYARADAMEVDDPAYEELRGKHTAVVTDIMQAVRARFSS